MSLSNGVKASKGFLECLGDVRNVRDEDLGSYIVSLTDSIVHSLDAPDEEMFTIFKSISGFAQRKEDEDGPDILSDAKKLLDMLEALPVEHMPRA
jgi:hypothetical protein